MSTESTPKQDTLSVIIIVLMGLIWLVPVSVTIQIVTWFLTQLQNELGISANVVWSMWLGSSLIQALMLGLPLTLAAIFWPERPYRAAYQTWLWGVGFILIMLPTRGWPETASQPVMVAQIGLSLVYLIILLFWLWVTNSKSNTPLFAWTWRAMGLALSLSAILAYPWLLYGALGSLLDVILSLIMGLLFGLLASLIISQIWLRYAPTSNLLLDGFITSLTLYMMVSGFSTNGIQIPLMLLMLFLGWLAMTLTHSRHPSATYWPALALFLGLTTAIPMMFTDSDGLMLIIGLGSGGELLQWVSWETNLTLLLSSSLTLFSFIAITWRKTSSPLLFTAFIGLVLWLMGGVIYLMIGQPGFYGDELFVVLKDQADVSSASKMTNYDERREFVYKTLVQHADQSQADLRARLDGFGIEYEPYYLVNALKVRGGLITRLWLTTRPEVDRVLPNPTMRPLPEPPPVTSGSIITAPTEIQWNLTNIHADQVWDELGIRGQGIIVGQSDSGVQGDHPELRETYRGLNTSDDYHWFDPWYGTSQPTDIGGHGTHTLGSILGQHVGVAPEATWIGCVNLGRNMGNPALYLECLQFMFAPFPQKSNPLRDGDPTKSAHVLNNSWGCPNPEGCDPMVLHPAVQALRSAGIFVVASAGNGGGLTGTVCESVNDPIALYDEVFSVGAVNEANDLAVFSSLGPVTVDGSNRVKPDIVAPGEDVLSAFPNSTYEKASGTSMAGPHVVGVVALMWSANPKLIGNIERTEQILTETAQPYTGPKTACGDPTTTPNNLAGYGIVDAYAAVKMALKE